MTDTSDIRIAQTLPLIAPVALAEELPLSDQQAELVHSSRRTIEDILVGKDKRVLAIVGPCSVHDPEALLDYARQFKAGTEHLTEQIFPVLRVYFEKPRTIVGWKGLINDPDLDGSFQIHKGLHLARQVLLDVLETGLPAASEFLDTTLGQYYAELVSFGAIGARTVESQIHRELASGLSMPVGFKNGTSGAVGVAIDAIRSARESHWFPSLAHTGQAAILKSTGNEHCHLILRGGGATGPNFESSHIRAAATQLADAGLPASIIVDCSHGNSRKDFSRQALVISDLCLQMEAGETAIRGVMLESNLQEGNQKVVDGEAVNYGQSITDACLSLENTLPLLEQIAATVGKS
jgi:3-deoxy-7-phosphoheptulonate synthase